MVQIVMAGEVAEAGMEPRLAYLQTACAARSPGSVLPRVLPPQPYLYWGLGSPSRTSSLHF